MNEALKKAINGISVAVVFLNLALVVLKLTKLFLRTDHR